MDIICLEQLDKPWQSEGVWRLLCRCDGDFVPPLSARESTCQSALHPGASAGEPTAYFEALKAQAFLLAVEDETVEGFLSCRPGYLPPPLALMERPGLLPLYVTTVIVDPDRRRSGIAREFYRTLLSLYPQRDRLVSTRTWSGNEGHINLLTDLRFTCLARLPNDRGPGVDTAYYCRFLPKGFTPEG